MDIQWLLTTESSNLDKESNLKIKSMKKILLIAAIILCSTVYAKNPNDKIIESFKKAFPNADHVVWTDYENSYQVEFNANLVKVKLWYDNDGNIIKTTRYYTEESLCPFILARLKQKYSDKKVFGITEVSSDEGLTYYIILEDDKKWYHVTVTSTGNMTLENKYNKA